MSGSIKWDVHLRAVAIRQGLHASASAPRICHLLHVWSRSHPAPLYSRVPAFGFLPNGHFRLCATLVNCVTLSGIMIFYGNSLFGITVGPAALAGPLAYPCANLGFTGEGTPADEKLLLGRGITRSALRHALGFVLRIVVAIRSRHHLPTVPSLPDHRAHISGNEQLFLSWIEPSPEEHLPSSWCFSAPRAIQWPHPAILRWVVTVFAMSLFVPHFITGGGGSPKVLLHRPYTGAFDMTICKDVARCGARWPTQCTYGKWAASFYARKQVRLWIVHGLAPPVVPQIGFSQGCRLAATSYLVFRYSSAGSHPTPVLCPGPRVHFRSSPPRSPPPTLFMVAWSGLWSMDIRVGISVYGWIPSCLLVTGKRHSGLLCSELFPWWVSHLGIAMRTSRWLFSRWACTRRLCGLLCWFK